MLQYAMFANKITANASFGTQLREVHQVPEGAFDPSHV
jgi:hypothetical protein